ncbi:hypothetical protein [Clostridium estertheticum]|uniref:Uncharacterized protein n=1 Tax=Clostridium estertheticum subsp. estertheticum TaxID=1552 RepID=A0A1J0GGA0_9CLOT|nr:hypothetical protein [Clostridium estertheticum]APC40323.1 hypothetical protein A7L45_09730 [Clostridium estertheticum subsp. estertheticum]MBU3174294.1 hypothetical protein [Clostridium estertheticum]MBZ9617860.1 hypothetical protein [Clostridium estertheticum subsp. laramiense]WAG73524.1 hypothetical protein LL032_20750 [Clostridium estertheticum]
MRRLKIQELMQINGMDYVIISYLKDDKIEKIGEINKLMNQDLPEQLFGDLEIIKNLNNSLENQDMPVTWKQGKVKCLVCKPTSDIIVGLFYNEYRALFDSIDFGKEINTKILNIYAK